MSGFLRRAKVELRDALAYSAAGRVARTAAARAQLATSLNSDARLVRRAAMLRVAGAGPVRRRIELQLQQAIDHEPAAVIRVHAAQPGGGRDGKPATRTTVLKAPGPNGERGVIYSAFEYSWVRIASQLGDLHPLLAQYDVVWATSWSPTDYLDVARLLAASDAADQIHLQASNLNEIPLLAALHPRIRVVPNLLCEYLDPASFDARPLPERDIDLLVVANWAPFKRHFELFRALRRLPATLRIVCVGQPERGHTRATIEQLAAAYGVPQAIEFRESLPLADVRALQARSKAAAVLSLREGSCVAAIEALFAGASLGLMQGAQVGSTAFVNDATGVLLRRGHVEDDLIRLIADAPERTPREWAIGHLGADRATATLNGWLKERAAERGLSWTTDIARMSWSPYPWVDNADARARLAPTVAELHRRFPGAFPADLLDSSRW